MSEFRIRSAEERREDIRAHAASLGIDQAYISVLEQIPADVGHRLYPAWRK